MGTWGVNLYQNDTASDIKEDYIDKLKRGKTNEEATNEIIYENKEILECDDNETADFWFALADVQWDLGRLLENVKVKALEYLDREEHLEVWKEQSDKILRKRKEVLQKLKHKLQSTMPLEKKISKYKIYKCEWKIGDIFAYQFLSEYSREKGFYGKYILFRKIAEEIEWPGHIVPIVNVFKWIGSEIPDVEVISKLEYLPQFYTPQFYNDRPKEKIIYRLQLSNTSKRIIPQNVKYINNVDIALPNNESVDNYMVTWSMFEKYIIDNYITWSLNI